MRYSKKRQAILDCLRSTKSHPTAEWIYEHMQTEYPNLSFATVYRNLNQFKETGDIRSVGIVNGHEHFDGNIAPHSHVVCSCCGRIVDVQDLQVPQEVIDDAERKTGYQIAEGSLQFKGVCDACLLQEAK